MEKFIVNNLVSLLAWVVLGAIMALIFVLGLYLWNFPGHLSAEHDIWGQFGAFIGGTLTPILNFLALLALLFTIILQSYELRITREEMKLARIAQQKTEAALKNQAITLQNQLVESKRVADMETFFRTVDRLQEENVRKARGHIFQLSIDEKKPYLDWTDQDKKTAEIACQNFDVVGMILRNGMVSQELILRSWHKTIKKSWLGTLPLVEDRRSKDGEKFWEDYEWLYNESLKYS